MCFGCAHRMDLESGKIPPNTSFDEYMKKYFWIKLPEGETIESILEKMRNKRQWSVYIVECADGTLYTGISNNVSKRVETHNNGKGAKYTKTRLPVALKYFKTCGNRSEASKEEYRIKKLTRKKKLELINNK